MPLPEQGRVEEEDSQSSTTRLLTKPLMASISSRRGDTQGGDMCQKSDGIDTWPVAASNLLIQSVCITSTPSPENCTPADG